MRRASTKPSKTKCRRAASSLVTTAITRWRLRTFQKQPAVSLRSSARYRRTIGIQARGLVFHILPHPPRADEFRLIVLLVWSSWLKWYRDRVSRRNPRSEGDKGRIA